MKGRHCRIYCTEPRRISAISLAQRVSRELGEPAGAVGTGSSLVGYAIRLESSINRRTRLAYVTNGIALRMLDERVGALEPQFVHLRAAAARVAAIRGVRGEGWAGAWGEPGADRGERWYGSKDARDGRGWGESRT